MEEQISWLQKAKNCMALATNHDAMKQCREALDVERKHHKEAEIDQRIHRLEEEKVRLEKSH